MLLLSFCFFVDAEPDVEDVSDACLVVVVVWVVVIDLFLLDVVDAKVDVGENVLDELQDDTGGSYSSQ